MLCFGRVGAGFMKEQLRVSTEGRNTMRVRGERLVGGNKWSRFLEDFEVPENSDMNSVRAKFHEGALTITIPKKIAVDKPGAPTPEKEAPKGSETQHRAPTPPSKDSVSKESNSLEEKHGGRDGAFKEEKTAGKTRLKPDDEPQTEEKGRGADQGAFTKKAVKGIGELNEERQLMVNMGVAMLVIVSLTAFVTYKFVSADNKK